MHCKENLPLDVRLLKAKRLLDNHVVDLENKIKLTF